MKYNSIEDFLIQNGSSWEEFIKEGKRTRLYIFFDEERSISSNGIMTYCYMKRSDDDELEIRPRKYSLDSLFNRAILWNKTTKGEPFWEDIHRKFTRFIIDNNIEEIPARGNKMKIQITSEMYKINLTSSSIEFMEELL